MTTPVSALEVQLQCRGRISAADERYARGKVVAAAHKAPAPVLFARAKLTVLADPALARPAVAEANLDIDGHLVRAQVARPTMREAIDELHDRLVARLERIAEDWEARRGRRPEPVEHEWRHVSPPAQRSEYFPRPVEDRRIVRHKTFTLATSTVDEAAFDMEQMDYDFHLFNEYGSGQDSVLYRDAETHGYRLAQVVPQPELVTPGAVPVTVSPAAAPTFTLAQAVRRLGDTGQPFVFFRDARTGRGRLVYHRYDGHYGLIVPAD